MLAGDLGRGIGEWGFAALLEVDGRRLLLDTGERAETVFRNANELGIDLSDVTDLVITHNHGDHTGGLVTLRRELAKKNARALSRAHVARGIFHRRPGADGSEGNGLLPLKAEYQKRSAVNSLSMPVRSSSFRQCGSPGLFRGSIPNAIGVARDGSRQQPAWSKTPSPRMPR